MQGTQLGRPVEILVVDDNPADVRLLQHTLSALRVPTRLHVVRDGYEALAFLRRHGPYQEAVRPDLILLDLHLPQTPGFDVLAELGEDPDLRRIPVIVLTSSADERDIEQSYAAFANCYVVKPADFESFLRVMQAIERFWLTVVQLPS